MRPKIVSGFNIRLTDRHSDDASRANLSSTGFGRLEIYSRAGITSDFLALRPENVLNNAATVACKKLGFNHGRLSHLTTNSIVQFQTFLLVISGLRERRIDKKEFILDCRSTTDSLESCLRRRDAMDRPMTNAVLLCTKNAEKNIQISPKINLKPCFISNQTNTIFSGSYDVADDCMTVQCPVMLWDINSVKLSDNIVSRCHTQQLDTTTREHWVTMWNTRCKNSPDHCSCHLPHEKLLGFIAEDPQHDEAYLISRQTYPNNRAANAKGLVLVSKLFSNEMPRLLNPVNEVLETGQLPVNHLIKERYLVSVYPTSNNGNVQLFAASLEHGNNKYQTQKYALSGKALLLTPDTIFIKDRYSTDIRSYRFNLIVNDGVTSDVVLSRSKYIVLPENTTDAFTATLKNDWFHVAATNNNDIGQIYVISYNVAENSWDPDWRRVDGLTSNHITNYNMVINNCNQIQFLSHDQIMSTNPVSVSIPEFGGCVSFSKVKEAEEFKVTVPTIQPAPAEIVSELPSMSTGLTSEISSTIPEISLVSTGITSELTSISTELTSETPSIILELTSSEIVEATPSVVLESENTDSVQSNNKLILAVALTTTVACVGGITGCYCGYNYEEIKNHFYKIKIKIKIKIKSKNEVSCKQEELYASPFGSIREYAANQQEEENTYLKLY